MRIFTNPIVCNKEIILKKKLSLEVIAFAFSPKQLSELKKMLANR